MLYIMCPRLRNPFLLSPRSVCELVLSSLPANIMILI